MFPIEENNCQIKSINNPAAMGSIDASASINESLSESLSTINSNNSTSASHIVESEVQICVEKQNVSNIYIFINCLCNINYILGINI